MSEKHSRAIPGGRAYWWTRRLWELSAELPIEEVPVSSIAELDMDCWFDGRRATCRAVADHARRIQEADLDVPIILAADGSLMDGGHRLAKAYLLGHETIEARRFPIDPEPDWIVTTDGDEVVGLDGGRVLECAGEDVSQVIIDYALTLRLGGGTVLMLQTPFTLRSPKGSDRVLDPGDPREAAAAVVLVHQVVQSVAVGRDGVLLVQFEDGHEIEASPNDAFEAWQIVQKDGSLTIAVPGGKITTFGPRP